MDPVEQPRSSWIWVVVGVVWLAVSLGLLLYAIGAVYWPLAPTLGIGLLLVFLIDRARAGRRG